MEVVNVNYLAVLACAVASMVTGFIWYGPLFGKAWMREIGVDPNDSAKMAQMQKQAMPGYVAMFIGSFITAYVFKHVLVNFEGDTISLGLQGAFYMWLGFVVPMFLGGVFFDKRSWTYYFISVGYYLVNLVVFSIILVSWM